MTAIEITCKVRNEYKEGQTVIMYFNTEERGHAKATKVTILKINPFTVLIQRAGYKESYTFWEFLQRLSQQGKKCKITIPEKLRKMAAG